MTIAKNCDVLNGAGPVVSSTIPAPCCAIPFTLNGAVHYSCVDNGTGVGCFDGDGQWKLCEHPAGKRSRRFYKINRYENYRGYTLNMAYFKSVIRSSLWEVRDLNVFDVNILKRLSMQNFRPSSEPSSAVTILRNHWAARTPPGPANAPLRPLVGRERTPWEPGPALGLDFRPFRLQLGYTPQICIIRKKSLKDALPVITPLIFL